MSIVDQILDARLEWMRANGAREPTNIKLGPREYTELRHWVVKNVDLSVMITPIETVDRILGMSIEIDPDATIEVLD